jgi:hypothetical protein
MTGCFGSTAASHHFTTWAAAYGQKQPLLNGKNGSLVVIQALLSIRRSHSLEADLNKA